MQREYSCNLRVHLLFLPFNHDDVITKLCLDWWVCIYWLIHWAGGKSKSGILKCTNLLMEKQNELKTATSCGTNSDSNSNHASSRNSWGCWSLETFFTYHWSSCHPSQITLIWIKNQPHIIHTIKGQCCLKILLKIIINRIFRKLKV